VAPPPEEEEEEEEVEAVVANLLYGFIPVMPPDDIEQANVPPSAADICYGWVGGGGGGSSSAPGKAAEEEPHDDASEVGNKSAFRTRLS